MSAYRSTGTYRQNLQYDGGEAINVTPYRSEITYRSSIKYSGNVLVTIVSPATITAAAAVPVPTIVEGAGVTVTVATVATTVIVPVQYVFQGGGIDVVSATIVAISTVPSVTVSVGTGIAVAFETVAATTTVFDPFISLGWTVVFENPVTGISTVPSLNLLMRNVPIYETIGPQIDVVLYPTISPARRLARFFTSGSRGRNVFILTNGSATTRQPTDHSTISRTLLGGHESPDDLTSEEIDALLAAGIGVEVR